MRQIQGEATCVTTIAQIKKLAEEILADAAEMYENIGRGA